MSYEWKDILKAKARISGSDLSEQMQDEIDEVYRKAEAFDQSKKDIKKNLDHLYELPPNSPKVKAKIDLLQGILITMDGNEFDAAHKRG